MSQFTATLPRHLYRAAQTRQLDALAIASGDRDGFTLMRSAAAAAFAALQETWPATRRLLVFAGSGNNGGDGYVMAALAREAGMHARVVELGDPESLSGEVAAARSLAAEGGVELGGWDAAEADALVTGRDTVVVDALLGTGLDREVGGDYAAAIRCVNALGCAVLAVDVPSGIDADSGAVRGSAVRADLTISFIGLKRGLLTGKASDHVGRLLFSDLDLPGELFLRDDAPAPEVQRIDSRLASELLRPRPATSHKGDNGQVLIVGGDRSFGGAVAMAAESAARAGAGKVTVITRSDHRPAILARRPELMVAGTEDEDTDMQGLLASADVIVAGPGLGRGEWSRRLLRVTLAGQRRHRIPLLLDADALQLLAAEHGDATARSRTSPEADKGIWILTPHPGEAAALLGCSIAEVEADRFAALDALQARWGGCILLKGRGSLMRGAAPTHFLCDEGNPGMASGGMGDVLSGIIAGLAAQGLAPMDALKLAVCVHGEAADLAAEERGERGLLATDLMPHLQTLLNPERRVDRHD